jgi:RNA polymerase sigma-70 factor (ECF subfamily)
MERGASVDERSDEDLLEAIADGPGALDEFYRRHARRMLAFGARRIADPEDVADFVASVFLTVLESAFGFDRRKGSAIGWLYGVGGHIAAAQRRGRARLNDAASRISGRSLLDAEDYERIERQVDAAAEARAVHAALEHLRPNDRRLLELVAVDGLTPAEAAAATGVSRVATRARLSRARRALRELMNQRPVVFDPAEEVAR